jgi:3-oxoacyl-[acyl-carrier protein] reductase
MNDLQSLHGRCALVTGASRGIGAAIAFELEARGAHVLRPERKVLDLESAASVAAFCCELPPVDILVNNAGINVIAPLDAISEESWNAMLTVNLSSPCHLMQGVVGSMKERRWGRIVNISSIFGRVSKEGRAAYSATKAAIESLTRASAIELAPYGICVNALCPGYVETEMTRRNNSVEALREIAASIPAQRLAQPEEIARCAAWLCSEEVSYLTGQSLVVDGGFTCR